MVAEGSRVKSKDLLMGCVVGRKVIQFGWSEEK